MSAPVDKSIQQINFLFKVTGFNIENRRRKWSENFIFSFNLFWVVTDVIGVLSWMVEGVYTGLNFVELTHVTPCLNMGMMAAFKIASMEYHERKVIELVTSIREMETKRLTDNPAGRKIEKKMTNFLHKLVSVMIAFNFLVGILFDFVPLIIIAVKYFNTNELELTLPFLDIYPVDCYDLRYWPFAYIHQIWTGLVVLLKIIAADLLFYICCTHISIQFKLLQHEVQNVIPCRSVRMGDDTLKEKFNDLVRWHQKIISCASMLNEIYTKSNLFNYLASSLIICLTGFNVLELDNKGNVVIFATFFCVGMMQIFFLCFFGDMLMDSSTGVSNAAYDCKWYLADAAMSKSTLIMLTRAQKPCKVTAGSFADVNLKAFMKILSSSWSYFALLQRMYTSDTV